MLTIYPAIFYQQKNGSYSVIFPDLHHLATEGENMEEAMSMAVDCLAGYIHTAQKDGSAIPAPTPMDKLDPHIEDEPDEDYSEEISRFITLVSVNVEEYARLLFNKSIKKTISIPQWMNDLAIANNINFSQTLQNGLRQELGLTS